MARGYDSGYGLRASELLLCGFGHCKAPVRWQLDSRENLDRLVATSQPGALVSGQLPLCVSGLAKAAALGGRRRATA